MIIILASASLRQIVKKADYYLKTYFLIERVEILKFFFNFWNLQFFSPPGQKQLSK